MSFYSRITHDFQQLKCLPTYAYLQLETYAEDVEYLGARFGLQMNDTNLHLNQRYKGNEAAEAARRFFSTLTRTQIEQLHKIYEVDFRIFGYEGEYKEFLDLGHE